MTATQWLFDKLWDTPKDKFTWYAILKEAEDMYNKQMFESFDIGISTKKEMTAMAMEKFSEDFEKLRIYMNEQNGKIHSDKRNKTD
jgi:hypothetical protein